MKGYCNICEKQNQANLGDFIEKMWDNKSICQSCNEKIKNIHTFYEKQGNKHTPEYLEFVTIQFSTLLFNIDDFIWRNLTKYGYIIVSEELKEMIQSDTDLELSSRKMKYCMNLTHNCKELRECLTTADKELSAAITKLFV